ncbi:proline-specific peptidase [Suillus discolor]|uniref:Proline-specific peptidase n=1 Tax=Suillus discolor TaxID=1912936 RepID=A0A9P7ET42_9AGAM|nr:proline-specific peptidase [Suillus discolor]KAG2086885.1 proline-specific peptidase [Suillus discolor]
MTEVTGKADFKVGDDTYQTWYKIVGDLTSGAHPLIVLHGGPGISHEYMTPLAEIHNKCNIPVVFYDQIGIGKSFFEGVADKPKVFWTVDLFMDELDNLVTHLGVQNGFALLGHSWGGMLGAHYASHRHPVGLKHLVISSGAPSMALWEQSTHKLLKALPADVRETIERHEKEGTTDSPEYEKMVGIFFEKHVCKSPWPKVMETSFAAMIQHPTVYHTMTGPSEFTITGTLKSWSCLDQIHTITAPTLLTNGVMDEAQDVCVSPFFQRIPHVKWAQFSQRHAPFLEEEDQARYFQVVADFLTYA